ncbi:MAG: 50S ribosomal protein L21e [Candidatus Pacearchaeota archaeon]
MKRLSLRLRQRGKLRLSEYFKELSEGDRVCLTPCLNAPPSLALNYPKAYRGLTGIIAGKQGKFYIVNVKKGSKIKKIITHPIHLKKLE